jgi:hypothetical protein
MNGNLVLCQLGMWWFFYFDKMLLKKEIGFFLWDEDKVELGKIVEIANRGASYEEKAAFVQVNYAQTPGLCVKYKSAIRH